MQFLACDIILKGVRMSRMRASPLPRVLCGGDNNRSGVTVWLLAIVLLAFTLRVARLDLQPLWWDEGWSLYFATSDIGSMLARTAIDIHPPLYYSLLHIWILIAGPAVLSVRLFSVAVGVLSVPLVFILGRRLFCTRVGIMVAMTMAVAPFHIYYSQEVRMYALVTFLVLCSMYLFVSLLGSEESVSSSRIRWAAYVVVTSLAMYTQYYAIFVPISQTIMFFARCKRHRPFIARWLGAQVALLVSYLPWILYAGAKLVNYVDTKMVKEGDVPIGFPAYFQRHLVAFSVGHPSGDRAFLAWLALIFIGFALLGAVGYLRYRPRLEDAPRRPVYAVAFALVYLVFPLFLGYLVNLRYPFTSSGIQRLFLLSAPGFYLLVALGLSWLWERFHLLWPSCLLLIGVSAFPLFDFYAVERYVGEDYRPLIEKVQAISRRDDVVVAIHPWQVGYFHAYYTGQLPTLYLTPKESADVTAEVWADDPALMAQELDFLSREHRLLWFPAHQALGRILEDEVEAYLSQAHYPLFGQWFSESTRLICYAGAEELHLSEQQANFGDKIALRSYGLMSGPVEATWDAMRIDLHWQIEAELDGKHQIALRLADDEGRTWAAQDSEPVGGLRPFDQQRVGSEIRDHHGLLIPAGMPPGYYELRLGLYRFEDGRWLDVLDSGGTARGVELTLGRVQVIAPDSPPPVEALFLQHPRQADFAPGIRFLGYSLGLESYRPGDSVQLTLFWQALADLHEDYRLSIELLDDTQQSWSSVEGPLARAAYPTGLWSKGELVRGLQTLPIPARAPGGDYQLVLRLHRSTDGQPVPLQRWILNRGDMYPLGSIEVQGRPHRTEPPANIQYPMSYQLGEAVQFLGYDLSRRQVSAGDSLRLTLYWHALAEMDTSYSVFTHLIDGQSHVWGQKDGIPDEGSLPTSSWLAGDYVIDEYEIPVQDNAPPGEYVLEIGMYDLATMIRLPIFDAQGGSIGDRIVLEATPIYIE